MGTLTRAEALRIFADAELIYDAAQVSAAVQRVADGLNQAYATRHPLVLSVMGGAVVFTGQLLPKLNFPLDFDFIAASRYGDATTGRELTWRVAPRSNILDRDVIVVDDILDEGITLAAICDLIREQGAASVATAVFSDKSIAKPKPISADYVGLSLPNRFVFGFGMDVQGAWRNLPSIHAMKEA
ncbi:MAG: hypoxanthine-guanine phosphoribosyltransferase [Betaproteobacteria bacterium]|nr:hypoxanthine-guanine phosphoribosyltransferase [Betaproteobacteria bacterium]